MQERKAPRETRQLDPASEAWNKLPWRKLENHCFHIQKRIYRASQRGNQKTVHKLQKLLMKSEAARLLAVRRVTQDNQGKKTAGIDGIKAVKPQGRLVMATDIHPKQGLLSSRCANLRRQEKEIICSLLLLFRLHSFTPPLHCISRGYHPHAYSQAGRTYRHPT